MEEEYKMLREEIMFNINKVHWYISIVSTIAIALLAYIFENPENIALISVLLASLVIMEGRVYSVTESNIKISTYIEVFLEPYLEKRNWETYNFIKIGQYNSRDINIRGSGILNFFTGANSVCFLIGCVAMLFNCVIIQDHVSLINVVFSVVNLFLTALLANMAIINKGGHQHRDIYKQHWQRIKDATSTEGNLSVNYRSID